MAQRSPSPKSQTRRPPRRNHRPPQPNPSRPPRPRPQPPPANLRFSQRIKKNRRLPPPSLSPHHPPHPNPRRFPRIPPHPPRPTHPRCPPRLAPALLSPRPIHPRPHPHRRNHRHCRILRRFRTPPPPLARWIPPYLHLRRNRFSRVIAHPNLSGSS